MSIILQVLKACLCLLEVYHSLKGYSCVQVGQVFLKLEELLLEEKRELLLRRLVHGLVDDDEGLLFVSTWWSAADLAHLGLQCSGQSFIDASELSLQLLVVDGHLFLVHFVLLAKLDLKGSDLLLLLPGLPSFFE